MVRIEKSVLIRADPGLVFRLVADLPRKARLDPGITVLDVAQETEGPLGVGSVFHYRTVVAGRIAEYRSRCVAFDPGRLIETVSDSTPPFRVRVTVETTAGGTRLTQEERFALPPNRIPLPRPGERLGHLLLRLLGETHSLVQAPQSIAEEEREMEAMLRPCLARWLAAIKHHLEATQSTLEA